MTVGRNGYGLNGSSIKYINALSPGDFNAAASSLPYNMGNYTWGTLVVNAGSINSGFEAHVLRSATSNGTFNGFGASIAFDTGSQMGVRSFPMNSSNLFYNVYYTNGTGSAVVGIDLIAAGAREQPIPNQAASVTVSQDVVQDV